MIELSISTVTDLDGVMDLLLLADPAEQMVRDYCKDGHVYEAVWDDLTVGVFVLIKLDDTTWELKNIAVADEWQGKGVGKRLLAAAEVKAAEPGATILEVGTGNSSLDQLAFYQKAGFRMQRIAKNFFTYNYPDPIEENGIPCLDLVIMAKPLGEQP